MIAANLHDDEKHLISHLSLNFAELYGMKKVFEKFKETFPYKDVKKDYLRLDLICP